MPDERTKTNKKKGAAFILCGVVAALLSIFADYLRHRPISFGPAQIALFLAGIGSIFLGGLIFFKRDIKWVDVWQFVKNTRHLKTFFILLEYVAIVLLLIHPIQYLIRWVPFPYMLGFRDVAEVYPAVGFAHGVNPYALQNYPEYLYVYGILFKFIMVPFLKGGANPFVVAHGVMLAFLVGLLITAFYFLRKMKASIPSALIGTLVFLNSMCFTWSLDAIRPDVGALFFGVVAFYIFFKKKITHLDLVLSALLCVLAFYCKQYMLFSAAILAIYLFFFVSKGKGLLYVLYTAVLGLGSFWVLCQFFPMLYNYMIIHHLSMYNGSILEHMYMQSRDFFRFYWPLCLFALLVLHKKISAFDFKKLLQKPGLSFRLNEPLFLNFSMNLWIIGLLIAVVALTFWLGKHSLSYYSYYGELLLPYLVFVTIPEIDHFFKDFPHKLMLQALFLGFCILPFGARYQLNVQSTLDSFKQLYETASQCQNLYDLTPFAASYKLLNNIHPIYNNGQTEYYVSVFPGNVPLLGKYSIVSDQQIQQRLDDWYGKIDLSISNQQFDCIFSQEALEINRYQLKTKFSGPIGSDIYVYSPTGR